MGSIAVNWVTVEDEMKKFTDFLMGWRARVRKDAASVELTGVRRTVYVEIMEEARARVVYDSSGFPFDGPKDGEYPGFFRLEASAMNRDLRDKHPSVFRERGYMNGIGYYMGLSDIAAERASQLCRDIVLAGADQAAKLARKKERAEAMLALSRGLAAVAQDMVCARLDFHKQVYTGGMSMAVVTMEHLEEEGQRGSSSGYGASSRAMRKEELKERVKLRAKIAAHQKEGRAYARAPKGGRKARQEVAGEESEGSDSLEGAESP